MKGLIGTILYVQDEDLNSTDEEEEEEDWRLVEEKKGENYFTEHLSTILA